MQHFTHRFPANLIFVLFVGAISPERTVLVQEDTISWPKTNI